MANLSVAAPKLPFAPLLLVAALAFCAGLLTGTGLPAVAPVTAPDAAQALSSAGYGVVAWKAGIAPAPAD